MKQLFAAALISIATQAQHTDNHTQKDHARIAESYNHNRAKCNA
jgi:hypothetical protein